MMCDLTLVGCYNRSHMTADERNKIMLASAKHNLESMAFFALTEYQKVTKFLPLHKSLCFTLIRKICVIIMLLDIINYSILTLLE